MLPEHLCASGTGSATGMWKGGRGLCPQELATYWEVGRPDNGRAGEHQGIDNRGPSSPPCGWGSEVSGLSGARISV